MAPRVTSASSTSQPSRQRGYPEPDEDEDVNAMSEEEAQATQNTGGLSEDDLRKKSAKLVRMAFGMERVKKPLKRGDFKYVAGHSQFKAVLARAQETLKRTFGMELIELPAKFQKGDEVEESQATQSKKGKGKGRGRRGMQGIEEEDEDEDQEEEMGPQPKKPKKATGLYVLRSTLSPALVEQMAKTLPFPNENLTENAPDHGAIIDWESGDSTPSGHIAMLGLRTVILCIIMCNNRVMSDESLHGFLKRLGIHGETPLPFLTSTCAASVPLTLDKFLDLLDKQLYLQRVKIPTPGQAENHMVEWRWGQRQAEFSEAAAAKFIEEVIFRGRDEEEEEDETPAGRRRRAAAADDGVTSVKEQRVIMRRNLHKAVGGNLKGSV